jgi:lactoylglutathione lyase
LQPKIALITLMTDHVPTMVKFYTDGLGFKVKLDMGQYVEIENEGVRFAICDRQIMLSSTRHASYSKSFQGQGFELAFPCDSPEDVDISFDQLLKHGAVSIQPPASMPWGQRAAFFADPEGYIHEIFSELPRP